MSWTSAKFLIAMPRSPIMVSGYTYGGLGLHMLVRGSPKGQRRASWALSHLGSGHRLLNLTGDFPTVAPVAMEVANAGDWSFDALDGWRNQFPDAPDRLAEILARHPSVVRRAAGISPEPGVASQIAAARA